MSDSILEKILIIDDSSDYRILIKTFINKLLPGVDVIEYDPVFEGIPDDSFNWSEVDVLLLDYHLSIVGTTGLDLLHKHHKKHAFPATIMLTGAGTEEIAIRALDMGIYEYQPKQSLTKDKLKQSIIHAWEEKKSVRKKKQEITQHNRSFSKEVFYEALEQAFSHKEIERALVIIKPDDIDTLEEEIGIIGRDNLVNHIAKNSFEVFKLGACNPNITRISDTEIGVQIDYPNNQETLDFNMQGLSKHLSKCTFKFSEEKYKYSVSIGILKLGMFNKSAEQLIHIASAACERANKIEGNSHYIWKESDVVPEPDDNEISITVIKEKESLELELKAAANAKQRVVEAMQGEQEAKKALEAKLKIAEEAKAKAEAELKLAAEAKEKAEAEAEMLVQEEARKKAEAELKLAAEAKIKADAELKIQEEARIQAEQKAKQETEILAAQEAKEKAEAEARVQAELRADQEAKQRLEAKLRAEVEAKAKAQAELRANQEAKEKVETRLKAEAEEKAKVAAQIRAEQEANAKLKAEAEMKAAREEKTKLEAELKAAAEAKEKAETEMKAAREEKIKLEAQLKAFMEAKEKTDVKPVEKIKETRSNTETDVKETEKHTESQQNDTAIPDQAPDVLLKNIEDQIKKLIDEKRITQTYQPVTAMFSDDDDEEKKIYKTGLQAISENDEFNEYLSNTSVFSITLQQTINEWVLRQVFLRITESGTAKCQYLFVINVTESWFSDITLFQWLQKILSQTKKYNPGKAIILDVPIDLFMKHQKRAEALISTLHKSHQFTIALSNIYSVDNIMAHCSSISPGLLMMDIEELKKLSETLAPHDEQVPVEDGAEIEKQNLLQYLKSKKIRIITSGIEDSTILTDAITAGTDYTVGSFVGEIQDNLVESKTVESFELT